ncbi:PREDICTED: juxtaposed with another zinc finger protein 1 [Merops nubicus]|uniref:juxtaposed with another zinc finger protein 1 n=1 Tax=Merops nubicus TaxID=57421 RepID=UPI0004F05D33|nr:PREDICTED: juxtaposed with another zinc finger protein 1 [Merops nubicus]
MYDYYGETPTKFKERSSKVGVGRSKYEQLSPVGQLDKINDKLQFQLLYKVICLSGSEYDEEEVDYEESDSDESWTTESAISSEAILSSMCMNGGDEKPFACPVPGCKKRYKNVNGIKYHAKNGHRTQIRVRKPFKCRCGKSYKTAQGLRHHTINFHPPVSAEIIRKMQQ